MAAFEESAFRFAFGATWAHVIGWDKGPPFTRGIGIVNGPLDGRNEGTKAVDFVGARDDEVWLLEVKDFRNRDREWAARVATLPLEIALVARPALAR